jgi:hypothetical protein
LESVDGFRDADDALLRVVEGTVRVVGDDDRCSLAGGKLLERWAAGRKGNEEGKRKRS